MTLGSDPHLPRQIRLPSRRIDTAVSFIDTSRPTYSAIFILRFPAPKPRAIARRPRGTIMIGRAAVGSTPAPTLSERWGDSLPRLPHVDAPRRPLRARVGVLETTPGGVHEPGEHCRPRSRQVHLSAPWG